MIEPKLLEPFGVADTFVSGLAEVEYVGGGCWRFTFFTVQHHDGREERVVAAKLIAPGDAVPDAVLKASKAVGMSIAMELRRAH